MASKDERKQAEQTFSESLSVGETPESILIKVMRGQDRIQSNGKRVRITKDMIAAAQTLLPYRLPRLNSIDAQVTNVQMTHEEWLKQLDEEE